MECHSDRFDDMSLLVFNDMKRLISTLPANIKGDTLYSHQGLTFGGFIINKEMKTETMLELFKTLKMFCLNLKITKIIYKCIPYIYDLRPSAEDLYALFINDFKLIKSDVTATINLYDKIKFLEGR